MTKTPTKKNLPFIIFFIVVKLILAFLAILVLIKPFLIIDYKHIFCGMLLAVSASLILMKLLFNAGVTNIIRHYFMKKELCMDKECLLKQNPTPGSILFSIFQGLLAITFSVVGAYLAFSLLFKKTVDNRLVLFSRIYCGIFAGSLLASTAIGALIGFIGHVYCKYKLTHGSDKDIENFKESVKNKSNLFVIILNFFNSIANFLLSIHFYACHLSVTRDHFTANYIAYDDGMRINKEYTGLNSEEEKLHNNGVFAKSEGMKVCDCEFVIDKKSTEKGEVFHLATHANIHHFDERDDFERPKVRKIQNIDKFYPEKEGIKINFIGLEICKHRFEKSNA